MRGLFCWADFVEFFGIKVENNETNATISCTLANINYIASQKLLCAFQ